MTMEQFNALKELIDARIERALSRVGVTDPIELSRWEEMVSAAEIAAYFAFDVDGARTGNAK